MMKIMSAQNQLKNLLTEAALSSGAERVKWLNAVRQYIESTNCDILDQELAQIDRIVLLRMLQAAGVPSCLQARFLIQISKAH